MNSAFGVDHGDFSKALKLPHRVALNKIPSGGPGSKAGYVRNRLASRYQAFNRPIPGSDYKATGRAHKELAQQYADEAGAVGRKMKRLP